MQNYGYIPQPTISMQNFANTPRTIATTPAHITAMAQGAHPAINSAAAYVPNVMTMPNNPRIPLMRMVPNQVAGIKQMPGAYTMKLLLFGEYLGNDANVLGMNWRKDDINYWKHLVSFFFSEDVSMKYVLWESSGGAPYELKLKYPIIPRFYQTFFESAVKSIQLILGIPKEQNTNVGCMLDCPKASMVYHYDNGSHVVHSGHLTVVFNQASKISNFEFKTKNFKEYVPRSQAGIASISPVNNYGIPLKTMRCLEVADGVDLMQDVITAEITNPHLGPIQAFHTIVRTQMTGIIGQAAAQTMPSPLETNAKPEKEQHPNLMGSNAGNAIGSPLQKLHTKSPSIPDKRLSSDNNSAAKKRPRTGQKTSPRK